MKRQFSLRPSRIWSATLGSLFVVAGGTALAETMVIQPSIAYTVKNLQNGVYQTKTPGLFSDGYPYVDSQGHTEARMEFQIPPEVLAGLTSLEFRAKQTAFTAGDAGYTYLFYYDGISVETTKFLSYARTGFTAKAVQPGDLFTRNLLEGYSGQPSPIPREKLGLIFSTNLTVKKKVVFENAQLVATYDPPPADNEEAVARLLTGAADPFEGETDPALINFDADPDEDGIANVFELWRGTNPEIPDAAAAPILNVLESGVPGQEVPFVQVKVSAEADNNLLIGAQTSHDLKNWRNVSATRTTIASGSTRYAKFTDTVPLGDHAGCYFRFVSEADGAKFE